MTVITAGGQVSSACVAGVVAQARCARRLNLHPDTHRADWLLMASRMDALRARAIPVTRIEEAEVHEWIRQADVIYGFDSASDGVGTFFGLDIIEDLAKPILDTWIES